MGLGLGWLRAVVQGYNYNYNTMDLWNHFQKNSISFRRNMGLGLGWLRAVAQGYNYSYNKIK